MKKLIREFALRLKADCEDCQSLVPRPIRVDFHAFGKWLYCATYGLTPAQVDIYLSGKEASAVDIIHANWCRRHYGETLKLEGGMSIDINISDHALLAMMAYNEFYGDWQRMLSVCGIHIEELSDIEESADTAERYDLPPGSQFFYIEGDEDG
ncbi:hypothetical protein [Nodosilinea nodulosa]|uniref:hypothetical protein n=1 Tax=Nodosilinea nodulosa TaxID=416001 RepID=UPI000378A32A|nr:hypothetical protein [Nodosilinea nodulosa]